MFQKLRDLYNLWKCRRIYRRFGISSTSVLRSLDKFREQMNCDHEWYEEPNPDENYCVVCHKCYLAMYNRDAAYHTERRNNRSNK